jgi:hypothetical protein
MGQTLHALKRRFHNDGESRRPPWYETYGVEDNVLVVSELAIVDPYAKHTSNAPGSLSPPGHHPDDGLGKTGLVKPLH